MAEPTMHDTMKQAKIMPGGRAGGRGDDSERPVSDECEREGTTVEVNTHRAGCLRRNSAQGSS